MVDSEETARGLLEQLGYGGARCIPARDGLEHHLFRVSLPEGERLLKFPRPDGLPDPFDAERAAEARLQAEAWAIGFALGVAVPPHYACHRTTPVCATMGIVPGISAELAFERGQLDEAGLLAVCLEMGKMLAVVHGRKRPADGGGLPDLPGADIATARMLHLDYHLGNILIRPALGAGWQLTGVVDWTCARWGPPEADLVEMQVSVWVSNPRARDAFIAGYRKVTPRLIDITDVEERAKIEIWRRLADDPPADEQLGRRWADWADTRR